MVRHDRWSLVAIKKFMVAEPVGSSVGTQSPIQNWKEEESDAFSHGCGRADCRSNEHDAACYWFGFPLVNHDALWLALLNEIRQPGTHAPNCSVIDCDGYVERKLPSIGSTQHIYVSEEEWTIVYRDVVDGKESETECAIVLRA